MEMRIGNQKVTKVLIGNHVLWDKKLQEISWIECPNNVGSGSFVVENYSLLAKYNEDLGTMTIQNEADFTGPTDYTKRPHLVLTLPQGFVFGGDNPTTGDFYDYGASGNKHTSFPLTYDGNQVFATFAVMYVGAGRFGCQPEGASSGISVFNVKRSDK